jgi:hypothetical protein
MVQGGSVRTHDDVGGFLLGSGLVLAEPTRLVQSAWIGHIPFAFWIIDALRPRSVVELGTYNGCSYSAFLQAISVLGSSASCYAVDTWKGDAHAGYYGEEVYQDLLAYHDARYGGFSRLLRMSFDEALTYFSDGSIDLLHIDGLHTYEAVSHDLRTWLPKASKRGLILMHDINVRERGFGVWRAWEEVSAKYPSFAFLHCHGLGVAWVGSDDMPDAIAWLTSLSHEGDQAIVDAVRSYFHRLGSGLIDRVSVRERDQVLAERGGEIARLTSGLAQSEGYRSSADVRINELQMELARQSRRQNYLSARVMQTDANAEGLRDALTNGHRLQIERLRAEHDAAVMRFRRSLSWRITAPLREIGRFAKRFRLTKHSHVSA